jgi:5'-nucleotidase
VQILITNDDGIHSPGLKILAETLVQLGDVTVVAPSQEQSGVSHALTYRTPLFAQKVNWKNGITAWSVAGTPADCVRIGMLNLMETRPELVVSGINHGLNLGINTVYSGTIAGAEEGALLGAVGAAVSLEYAADPPWKAASEVTADLLKKLINYHKSESVFFNINIPLKACEPDEPRNVRVTSADVVPYLSDYEDRVSPGGSHYYWFLSGKSHRNPLAGTDRDAFQKGFVTITPLDYNRTKESELESLENWFSRKEFEPEKASPPLLFQKKDLFADGT